jgi:hypothetical protein
LRPEGPQNEIRELLVANCPITLAWLLPTLSWRLQQLRGFDIKSLGQATDYFKGGEEHTLLDLA